MTSKESSRAGVLPEKTTHGHTPQNTGPVRILRAHDFSTTLKKPRPDPLASRLASLILDFEIEEDTEQQRVDDWMDEINSVAHRYRVIHGRAA